MSWRHRNEPTVSAIDLPSLLKDVPRGAWEAISSDRQRVVAYGFDMRKVLTDAKDHGEAAPILTRVPESAMAVML